MKKTIVLVLSAVLVTAAAFAQRPQFRMPEPPSDPAYITRADSVMSDGNMIRGIAVIPRNASGKLPVVIMSHGYGGSSMGFYQSMDKFAKEGFICFAYDFAGGGRMSKSDGKSTEMSILTEKRNLMDVIDYVRTWPEVDRKNVFLWGESQGGCVSAITAPDVKRKVNAIVLYYPAFCILDDGKKMYGSLDNVPQTINFMNLEIGKKYYSDIWNYNIYNVISKFKKDVLIVHGDYDRLVNIAYSNMAMNYYKNAELKVIPKAGHGFWGPDKATADGYNLEFLKAHVR